MVIKYQIQIAPTLQSGGLKLLRQPYHAIWQFMLIIDNRLMFWIFFLEPLSKSRKKPRQLAKFQGGFHNSHGITINGVHYQLLPLLIGKQQGFTLLKSCMLHGIGNILLQPGYISRPCQCSSLMCLYSLAVAGFSSTSSWVAAG